MKESEQLLESLLDLERARQREHDLRIETEALLEGLRGITYADDTETLFCALVKVLHTVIEFEEAFILQAKINEGMVPVASTSDRLKGTIWQPLSVFNRVMAGRPAAVFDVAQVPEWASQPDAVREGIKSALHIGLSSGHQAAILVVTHSSPRHFGAAQVKQAGRFAPLASQALLTLDLQSAIKQRDRFFQLSLNLMGIISFTGRFMQFNTAWSRILGYSEKDLQQCSLFDWVHADDRIPFLEAVLQLDSVGKQVLVEHRFICQDGSYRWLSCSLAAYPEEQLCYLVAQDVTDRVLAEQRLEHDAYHDPLTGLYNRGAFIARLKEAISYAARQPQYHFALLFLDLNRFKIINDTLGHNVGDELLKDVSRRLLGSVREVDIVGRLGGDEFVILLMDIELPAGAECVAQRIHNRMTQPVTIQGNEITPSTSIGIALSSQGYKNAEAMISDADMAMYIAKSKGKSQHEVPNKS